MKMTVKEIAQQLGVSVRTLHYYDEIGLLYPSETTEAGYRLYDEKALSRLMQILFFRELEFPLAQIRDFLDTPSFDRDEALKNHRKLLKMKRQRLDRLIRLVDSIQKGEMNMDQMKQAFDDGEILAAKEKYAKEAERRWGNTDSYRESAKKTAAYSKADWERVQQEMDEIFAGFASCRGIEPNAPSVQELVKAWQQHITQNYYACTETILADLGQMYLADERFTHSIDGKYGEGVAKLISEAIAAYCK